MKKIAFIALAAALTSLGATADTIVTSKTYVDTTRQPKITPATTGHVVIYNGTDTAANGGAAILSSQAVFSNTNASAYTSSNAGDLATMGAVMAQINGSVPSGTANNVATYDAQGKLSSTGRGVYSDASSYTAGTDADKLVTASALNTVKTAVTTLQNCTHTCASSDGGTTPCDLITINCVEPAPAGNQN